MMFRSCALIVVSFVVIIQSPSLAQNLDYGPFPGNVYLNFSFGKMIATPNRSFQTDPLNLWIIGATVQRNLIVRSDTVAPNGVGEPILAGRLAVSWMAQLNFLGELNLVLYLGRRPGATYISAGVTAILLGMLSTDYQGHYVEWDRDHPLVEPYYALGVGFDVHPLFTAEMKWWHAFRTTSIHTRVDDYRKDWIVNVDIFALTIGIPL
jgi:hypothetical protein